MSIDKKNILCAFEGLVRLDERLNVYSDQDSLELSDFKEFNNELNDIFNDLGLNGFKGIHSNDLHSANEIFIENYIIIENAVKGVLL